MRIAHLIFSRHFAGSERHAIELANAQAEHHTVMLVLRRTAARGADGGYAARVDPRVELVLVDDWLGRWQARHALNAFRPDVAHAHLSGACKALASWRTSALRVATLHIRYKPQQHARLDALIAIAPWQLADLPPALREHSTQIDNWTLPHSPAPGARERLRAELGIAPDDWVFGALGRVERSKGFDVLALAFAQAALPQARLVIVGRGPELERLRARATPGVALPGFADRPQDWLAAFDAFVSPARSEPFGLVFLEAMQAGLPVLATRTQGAEHLAPVLAPRWAPVDDAPALADALRAMAVERPARRHYPLERFRLQDKLPQIEAFYRAELARRPAPAA